MISLFLAEADGTNFNLVVQTLSVLSTLALTIILLVKGVGSKAGERQVEPTEMHAMVTELKSQTVTLNNINRETGELKMQIGAVDKKIDAQADQVENAFRRINAISIESAGVKTRVDGLENREGRHHA